jgi:hypothetical protein
MSKIFQAKYLKRAAGNAILVKKSFSQKEVAAVLLRTYMTLAVTSTLRIILLNVIRTLLKKEESMQG